jgi:U3 small nucleolar RNA-associated protein 23
MRQIPGVPLIYIKRAVMVMEPISPATLDRRDALERTKLGGMERLSKRKERDEDDEDKPIKKKKGPKEPNPLSVKRKKKPTQDSSNIVTETSTRNDAEGAVEVEANVIGEVTDSVRRHKSTRRRKHHKKPAQQGEEMIPTETEAQE